MAKTFDFIPERSPKLLIGVNHSDYSPSLTSAKMLIFKAAKRGAKSVALETSFGNHNLENIGFFSDLERYAKDIGMHVHRIDSPFGRKRTVAASIAMDIQKGLAKKWETSKGSVSALLSSTRSRIKALNIAACKVPDYLNQDLEFYSSYLKFVEEGQKLAKIKNEEEIRNIYERLNLSRSKIMLKRIRRVNSDVAVVGSAHLPHMRDSLNDYEVHDIS